ncbi:hypothetical protein BDA96_03G432700 [Sorghum bicolor]|uniref:Uncharacterized protein n=1 Tax=Sorghum bicolor TaxID=4558 RepID=A0A921RI48_SORBI|nr:hypothetical protein BDA96_03G432700 [Sorghum bicolor]
MCSDPQPKVPRSLEQNPGETIILAMHGIGMPPDRSGFITGGGSSLHARRQWQIVRVRVRLGGSDGPRSG